MGGLQAKISVKPNCFTFSSFPDISGWDFFYTIISFECNQKSTRQGLRRVVFFLLTWCPSRYNSWSPIVVGVWRKPNLVQSGNVLVEGVRDPNILRSFGERNWYPSHILLGISLAALSLMTLVITPTALLCKSKITENAALAVLNILTRDGEGGIFEVVRSRLFHVHNSNYSIFTNPTNTIHLTIICSNSFQNDAFLSNNPDLPRFG